MSDEGKKEQRGDVRYEFGEPLVEIQTRELYFRTSQLDKRLSEVERRLNELEGSRAATPIESAETVTIDGVTMTKAQYEALSQLIYEIGRTVVIGDRHYLAFKKVAIAWRELHRESI